MRNGCSIVPCSLREANFFVAQHHRHHGEVTGHKFSLALASEECILGVAIVGRPLARRLDDGWTLEVMRVATDGSKNACSALYGAAWRAARALGYRQLVTYTLESEPGTSLIAAGWACVGKAGGGPWSRASRPRVDTHPLQSKIRWQASLADSSSPLRPAPRKATDTLSLLDDSYLAKRQA